MILFYLAWEESERGYGTRPDGFSLHVSEDDGKEFVANFHKSLPMIVPHTYSRPFSGVFIPVVVSDSLHAFTSAQVDRSYRSSANDMNKDLLARFDAVPMMKQQLEQLIAKIEEGKRARERVAELKPQYNDFILKSIEGASST